MTAAASHRARIAARKAVDLPCELCVAEWDRPIDSWCTDLSESGMRLQTSFPLFEDKIVAVSFRPPHSSCEVSLLARVRHVAAPLVGGGTGVFGAGLHFVAVSDEERRLLTHSLRGLPPPLPGVRAPAHSTIRPTARESAPDTVRDPSTALQAASELPPESVDAAAQWKSRERTASC